MPEHKKRIIVEGVDFQQLFQFPKLLRSITHALFPGRLIIGLLMVTALITLGHIWDSMTLPKVAPGGLSFGKWNETVHGPDYQAALRRGLSRFQLASPLAVGGAGTPGSPNLDPDEARGRIRDEYENRRDTVESAETRLENDQNYVQAMNEIDATAPRGVYEATADHVATHFLLIGGSLLSLNFASMLDHLGEIIIGVPVTLWRDYPWFTVIFGALTLLIFAIGGGAIARMVAHQVGGAGDQRLGAREGLDFSLQRVWPLFSAQVLPFILAGIICIVIMVMGVLMAAPMLDVVGSLLYGIALALGLVLAFLLIGYIVGHPMLIPAVACENCSGPDAMQRAYAYVTTRPLHALWYWLIGLIGFAIGFIIVSLFAALTLNATASLYEALVSTPALTTTGDFFNVVRHVPDAPLPTWHDSWAASIISFWETLVICLVAAYVLSYFFTASTIGYLLMRREADGQEISEIWQQGFVPGTFAPTPASSAHEIEAPAPSPT